MPRICLVVSDLDDTLLDASKSICDEAVDVIEKLAARGVRFTFITGRPPTAVDRFARCVHLTAPMVCCNGAMLVQEGKVLEMQTFSLALLREVAKKAVSENMNILLFDGETEWALSQTGWTHARKAAGRDIPMLAEDAFYAIEQVVKLTIMAEGYSDAFLEMIPSIQHFAGDVAVSLYGSNGCEIVAKQANKAVGLSRLCAMLGFDERMVLAIGDNENDIQMLRTAGIGAAVANATEGAKASADYVCERSFTDGVIEAIERFVGVGVD